MLLLSSCSLEKYKNCKLRCYQEKLSDWYATPYCLLASSSALITGAAPPQYNIPHVSIAFVVRIDLTKSASETAHAIHYIFDRIVSLPFHTTVLVYLMCSPVISKSHG